jgi:hypothetical protein
LKQIISIKILANFAIINAFIDMYFKLSASTEDYLLKLPETGMGYQIVNATRAGEYSPEKFMVLNSEIAIEMNRNIGEDIRKIMNNVNYASKSEILTVSLNIRSVLNKIQSAHTLNMLSEPTDGAKGAIDNPVTWANGTDMFVRLSAFDNDKRIDKIGGHLLPGSFATTDADLQKCREYKYDPIEWYALPSNDEIKYVFYIQPLKTDTLQRGIVQPANEKKGGGEEAYFANGTSLGTFKGQINYF